MPLWQLMMRMRRLQLQKLPLQKKPLPKQKKPIPKGEFKNLIDHASSELAQIQLDKGVKAYQD